MLNSHNVEYLIVGGHAVAFHGYPRFTGDIDVFIRMTAPNAERLLAVLNEFGFGTIGITARELLEPKRVLRLGRPPNQIDILTSISGVDFDAAWDTRVQSIMDNQPVSIIGWTELLQNKRAAARQKDLADVDKLVALAKRKGAG